MIGSFRSRALAAFWNKGDGSRIRPDLRERVLQRLNALDAAGAPERLNLPGYNFHKLRGEPVRYTVQINGPWCITFEWEGEEALRVDLEQYH